MLVTLVISYMTRYNTSNAYSHTDLLQDRWRGEKLMKYFFVFLTIVAIWAAIIIIALGVYPDAGLELFLTGQFLTLVLVYVGYQRR